MLPDKKYLEPINSGTGVDKVIKSEVINAIEELPVSRSFLA